MTTQDDPTPSPPAPPPLGFHWPSLLWWLPLCAIQGAAVAWAACRVQVDLGYAPFVLFPVLAGLLLGVTGVGLLRLLQMGSRPVAIIGTLVAVTAAVVGQHYFLYRDDCRGRNESLEQLLQSHGAFASREVLQKQFGPQGFAQYLRAQARIGRPVIGDRMARGVWAWLSWALDAALMLAAMLAVVVPAMKQPYCRRCGSWYRTVRSGRIDAAAGPQLAQAAGLQTPETTTSARYRLFSCTGGCGPTGFELSWRGATAAGTWLDKATRERVTDLLDKITEPMKDN